ncbi:MAG: hypothetical protein AAGD38_10130 [Acidobacteriota bacterium]
MHQATRATLADAIVHPYVPSSGRTLTAEALRERTFWALYLETNDTVDSLADTVLSRLTKQSEAHLLSLDPECRQRIQARLRDDAISRLRRLAITDEQFDRACGHPTLLAELALEAQGHYLTAAALHAINHDNLAEVLDNEKLLALRFKVARALVSADGIENITRGIAVMEQALDHIRDDQRGRQLRADVLAWLSRRYAELGFEEEAAHARARATDVVEQT